MEEGFRQETSKLRLNRKKEKMDEGRRGRLVQSTGRKDRHSKVCTAKGPRDRRVRLSAPTAIRFYDVQDRLGCDRPSKAIDWLMKEAKAAIEALDELPSRNPNCTTTMAYQQPQQKIEEERTTNLAYGFQNQQQMDGNIPTNSFRFSSSIDFNSYPTGLNSGSRSQAHENSLSVQSFQENPILLQQHSHLSLPSGDQQSLFSASTAIDSNVMQDMGWFQRMVTSNPNSNSGNCKGSEEGLVADLQQVLVQNQLFSQREPLQSSFSASIQMPEFNPPLVIGNLFGNDGLSGFSVSPQFEGQQTEQSSFFN